MNTVNVIKALRGMNSLFDHGKVTLEYEPDKWVYPSVGKIYAFEDYESASAWARDYPGSSLWEAEAEIFNTKPCMFCANIHCDLWVFWKFYMLFLRRELFLLPSGMNASRSPAGTVLCNRVMIVKKLKDL